MPNIVTIAKDVRLRKLTEQYLAELGMDSLRIASFESADEFASVYFRDKKASEKQEEGPGETDLRLFSEVHLLLFALDSIGSEKPKAWIEKVILQLKWFKQYPLNTPFQMLMLKYEDDGLNKVDLIYPALTDILFLPLDRLVFLQKLEIFLNYPKKVKNSFLFNQEVKGSIEISKRSRVERFSDVGLAICNPVALKKGLAAHFYLNLPGEKAAIEVYGKVFRSEPHPTAEKQFLVYFSYFGISKATLSTIRRFLSKVSGYQSLSNENRSMFRFNYSEVFMGDDKSRNQHLVVIDSDAHELRDLAALASKEMGGLDVATETSYSVFLHKYLGGGFESQTGEPPLPTELSDFYQSEIRMRVSSPDAKLISVENPPAPGEKFLKYQADDLFASPERWLEILPDKAARLLVEESLALALGENTVERILPVKDESGLLRAVLASFKKVNATEGVSLRLRPAPKDDVNMHFGSGPKHLGLEALLVDRIFLPENVQAWTAELKTQASTSNLVAKNVEPRFFVMSDSDRPIQKSWIATPEIAGLFLKPVDQRQFMFLLSEAIQNKTTVYNFENLGWATPNLDVHLAKDIELDALAEFGATLRSKQALKPGTIVYLRGSIFQSAPNNCLAARVYFCEEHATEKDSFAVYLTYFGINDNFLKYARAWIRENYASSKKSD